MPKPFLIKGSSHYYVKIKEWDAESKEWKWVKRSTRTDAYDLACSMQESFQVSANTAKKLEGKTIDRDYIRSVITSIYASAGVIIENDEPWPAIHERMKRFMKTRKSRVTKSTYQSYQTCERIFLKRVPKDARLDWFDQQKASDFYEEMLESFAPKTANERLRFVSRFYDRAIKEINYPTNPCRAVDVAGNKSGEQLERLPFTYEEVLQIVDHLQKGDDREREWARACMISVMSGARLEDAITVHSSNIVKGALIYTQKKTGKKQHIPLVVPDWKTELEQIDGFICPELNIDSTTSKAHNISKEFTALVSEAGIEQKYRKFKSGRTVARKTFHSLRHTLRTLIVSSGGSDAQADVILGHSAGQGKTYTHSETEAARAVLEKVFKPSP